MMIAAEAMMTMAMTMLLIIAMASMATSPTTAMTMNTTVANMHEDGGRARRTADEDER